MRETARSFCLRADGIGRSLRTGNDRIASFNQKVNKKKGRGLYRYQGIFHVPGLHPAALTQLQGAGVCLQGQRCRPPRRRAGSAAAVHPGALRQAGIYHQRLPHRCPQRCRGRQRCGQHLLGRAADFHVEGVPVAAVAAYAETLLPSRGGIGRYPKDAAHPKRSTGWVHIDTRASKSRWKM